jgi:hypothetical protein
MGRSSNHDMRAVFAFEIPSLQSDRREHPARITPYPTGRLLWGGADPGTSCQATIAPSLRDISQQALANPSANFFACRHFREGIEEETDEVGI